MIINSKYLSKTPFIFVHIPKTGGMSVLNSMSCWDPIYHESIESDIDKIKEKKENPDDYFKFTIIRNPWDRIVSNFFFHKQRIHNDTILHKVLFNKKEKEKLKKWIILHEAEDLFWKKYEFKDWLKFLEEEPSENKSLSILEEEPSENKSLSILEEEPSENKSLSILKEEPSENKSLYTNVIKKNYMDLIAINSKISVDYIINFHNLNRELNLIKVLSGKSFNNSVNSWKNKSNHNDYREYYDNKSIEIVEKIFKKDIEIFNFKFDIKEHAEYKKYIKEDRVKEFIKKVSFRVI